MSARRTRPVLTTLLAGMAALLLLARDLPAQLSPLGSRVWRQSHVGLSDEMNDQFGAALAVGDFNGDGRDDLAVGAPGETVSVDEGGSVVVIFGGESGLESTGSQFIQESLCGDAVERFDHFGEVLAAGNFNRDSYDDLAIGIPGENLVASGGAAVLDAGAVCVLYGSALGLTGAGAAFLHLGLSGLSGDLDANDHFGTALAAGDFDLDTYDDLAIGNPGDSGGVDPPFDDNVGSITVVRGGSGGLTTSGSIRIAWGAGLGGNRPEAMGAALVAGNFSADATRRSELVVGMPDSTIFTTEGVATQVLEGGKILWLRNLFSPSRQTRAFRRLITGADGSHFGAALAAGDVDCDGIDELLAAAPEDRVSGQTAAGRVYLFDNAEFDNGPVYDSGRSMTSLSFGLGPLPEDHVGETLAMADFDADGCDELVIGAPRFDRFGTDDGIVWVVPGSPLGEQLGDSFIALDLLLTTVSPGDQIGASLATGAFSGSAPDLVMGAPFADAGSADAGQVHLLPNQIIFADGFESGDTSAFSAAVP